MRRRQRRALGAHRRGELPSRGAADGAPHLGRPKGTGGDRDDATASAQTGPLAANPEMLRATRRLTLPHARVAEHATTGFPANRTRGRCRHEPVLGPIRDPAAREQQPPVKTAGTRG